MSVKCKETPIGWHKWNRLAGNLFGVFYNKLVIHHFSCNFDENNVAKHFAFCLLILPKQCSKSTILLVFQNTLNIYFTKKHWNGKSNEVNKHNLLSTYYLQKHIRKFIHHYFICQRNSMKMYISKSNKSFS